MIEFTIRIADKVFFINALYDNSRTYCAEYICHGEAENTITITPADITKERELAIREAKLEGLSPRQHTDAYLETLAIQRKIAEYLFQCNTILFHGSVIAVNGVAYLFTAKSGTGKSTHTRLWREMFGDAAVMVNDDKPFLHIDSNGVVAYGSPWCGKHRMGRNISAPLRAICILHRGEENCIHKMDKQDALFMLLQQSHRPGNAVNMLHYMDLLDKLAKLVDFYHLECNMNPEAALLSYEVMSGEKWRK